MKAFVLALGLSCAALVPAIASANEPMTMHADDDRVVLEFTGVTPVDDEVTARGDKLIVRVTGGPPGVIGQNASDPLIKRIAMIGGEAPRVLAVVRGASRTATRLAERSKIERTENGFRLVIARRAAPAPVLEQPVDSTPAAAPQVAPPSPVAPTEPAADEEPTPAPAITMEPARAEEAPEAAASLPSTTTRPGLGLGTVVSLGLVLVAAGAMFVARKKGRLPWLAQLGIARSETPIRIEGSALLAGRTRAVLVAIADRRILVAVGEGGTSVLDRWNADASGPSQDAAVAPAPAFDAALERAWHLGIDRETAPTAPHQTASSPAVAGILKLRRAKARRSLSGFAPTGSDTVSR